MANIITGGTPVTPIGTGNTLAELVTRWRLRLDDTTETYLWSNQELTDYFNYCCNVLCREIPLIEDTTSAICSVTVAEDADVLSISDRIVWIKRAKLASDTSPLQFTSVEEMDQTVPGWEDAASGDVSRLIVYGVGTNKVRLYPPSSAADTLSLSIVRLPLYDLVYATDSAAAPEIQSKYIDKVDDGVLHYAYLKQDADTMDVKKADYHRNLWMRNIEEIKRSMVKYQHRELVVAPMRAFL